MRNTTGADDGDAFRHCLTRPAHRLTKRPRPLERRKGRPLTVDVHRNDRDVIVGCEEVERHHDAVVKLPLFGIGNVGTLHHFGDEPL